MVDCHVVKTYVQDEKHSRSPILKLIGMVYSEILFKPMSNEDFDASLNKTYMDRYELFPNKVGLIP